MTAPNHALESAIALSRAPRLVRVMRSTRLPEGLTFLLRILSGERQALVEAQHMTRLDEEAIISIVEFYVLQVMLFRGASSRRILGVEPGAERSQIRRHMGYLMNWLHPDREANTWRVAFARRVLDAWHQIERGTEEDGPRLPSATTRTGRQRFLIPWIAVRPPRAAWVSFPFIGIWRRLKQLGMAAVTLVVVARRKTP
jgi:hypothetical protein